MIGLDKQAGAGLSRRATCEWDGQACPSPIRPWGSEVTLGFSLKVLVYQEPLTAPQCLGVSQPCNCNLQRQRLGTGCAGQATVPNMALELSSCKLLRVSRRYFSVTGEKDDEDEEMKKRREKQRRRDRTRDRAADR